MTVKCVEITSLCIVVSVTYYRNSGSVFREGWVLEQMTLLNYVCVSECVCKEWQEVVIGIGPNGR